MTTTEAPNKPHILKRLIHWLSICLIAPLIGAIPTRQELGLQPSDGEQLEAAIRRTAELWGCTPEEVLAHHRDDLQRELTAAVGAEESARILEVMDAQLKG